MGRWNYLAVTYNKVKGVGTIWRNGFPVAQVRQETITDSFQFLIIIAILTLTSPFDINVTTRLTRDTLEEQKQCFTIPTKNILKVGYTAAQHISLSFYRFVNKRVTVRITI